VVNTKVNVGANHNQAFVEFADLNQAISMVSYYASSSEPAQVRGKTVYLQYSNRQEIVTSKNSGDVASNVLLVTIEGVEAGHVSIDVLHLVSSTPLSDGSGVQNPNDYHHSCQGSGIIKGDLERWRCNKWSIFTQESQGIWSSSVQLQAEMNLGFLRASSYLDYVKFQLFFLGFWWTRGLSFTETYMDQQVHVTATSSMAACCMGESACVFVSLPLPP
jgi:hypothetical protein